MSAAQQLAPSPSHSRALLRMGIGALLGAVVGYSAVRALINLHVAVKTMHGADYISLWIGVCFLGFGLIYGFISTSRRRIAVTLEGESATLPASREEIALFRMQAAVLVLAGLLLLVPMLAQAPVGQQHGGLLYAGVLLLFAGQTWLNVRIWRLSDEYMRFLILLVAALTFAVSQAVIFLWAAAERLLGVTPLDSWTNLMILMGTYLVTSTVLSIRHARR